MYSEKPYMQVNDIVRMQKSVAYAHTEILNSHTSYNTIHTTQIALDLAIKHHKHINFH